MSQTMQTSIIIPVHGQWHLTEGCLRSLAATLQGEQHEVIVVDNASSDQTQQACPSLGRELFGSRFLYQREQNNRNFGPASNIGARLAQGEYLFFLNNDTLARPGWYAPLLQDFTDHPGIACTGPLLTYPAKGPLGETVQHLGVQVNPFHDVHHLYEGISAASPLVARRRRFFQVISAAAMLMPRALFLEQGGFDEAYINGFEDVDLCARLQHKGFRMTVNPASRICHLAGQTPGRHSHEDQNAELFRRKNHHLTPDWHLHLASDGLALSLSEWQTLLPAMPEAMTRRLLALLRQADLSAITEALVECPFWYDGYEALGRLLHKAGRLEDAHAVHTALATLRPVPEPLFALLETASRLKDTQAAHFALTRLFHHCIDFEQRLQKAHDLHSLALELGLPELAGQCAAWLEHSTSFRKNTHLPFIRRFDGIGLFTGAAPHVDKAYTVWRELEDSPEQRANKRPPVPAGLEEQVRFSVLMPVYNPRPEHLRAAVASVLDQLWPHWELCMADDASTDTAIRPLLLELAALDQRIRVEFREKNGNIAAASNTALAMARHPYAALLDQDDILSPDALLEVALALSANPDAALIYSDEDKFDDEGAFFSPYFKSYWDPVLCEGQNMVSHLGVYATTRMRAVGGFRPGYDGSQDYDLLWRFVEGLGPEQIVHIPKVLYHWRCHEGSVALAVTEKSSAVLDNFQRALADHVQRTGQKGTVQMVSATAYCRVAYEPPTPLPLVSLLLDLGSQPALGKTLIPLWLESAGYDKLELLLAAGPDPALARRIERLTALDPRVRAVPVSKSDWAGRMNALANAARGTILGFLGKGLTPLSQSWLLELASRCLLPGTGVAGGKLLTPDRRIAHCGFAVDAGEQLFALHQGLPAFDPGYFCWASLARTVPAVDRRCLFTKRELFEQLGGFTREDDSCAAGIDYCLRANNQGLRGIFTPYAAFTLGPGSEAEAYDAHPGVGESPPSIIPCRAPLTPCNPNLSTGRDGWALYRRPRHTHDSHSGK